jgi:hypothetical protein
MQDVRPRRNFLKLALAVFPMAFPFPMLGLESRLFGLTPGEQWSSSPTAPVADLFPTQPPELAREMVTVSHYDLNRVKELVEARPSLSRAAWDWGFGDWETALGAASHMGNRPIAEYLISKGGRPSLFSSAMLGHLEVVKAFVAAQPGVQRIRGPHSISLLAHAKAGGQASRPVFEFLQSLGDADTDPQIPLSDSDAEGLRGIYVFGPAMNQQVDITVEQGGVVWTRKGMMGRQLFYLGGRVFCPAGAPAARIRFREEGAAMLMTIEDPEVILVARRKQEPK